MTVRLDRTATEDDDHGDDLGPLFEADGDRWVPQPHARGPWSTDALHGGPPAALLGRAVEHHEPADPPMFVGRLTFEILRPVPTAPLSITTRTIRPGKRVQLVDAEMRDGDTEVMRARALRLHRLEDLDTRDAPVPPWSAPPPPGEVRSRWKLAIPWVSFGDAMEIRMVTGQPFLELGPASCWFRLLAPLVPGEVPSPLARVLAASDFPNGVANVLDFERFVYINPDLSVSLHRLPAGEWVFLDAATHLGRGHGTAEARLADEHGPLGRSYQSLLIFPR